MSIQFQNFFIVLIIFDYLFSLSGNLIRRMLDQLPRLPMIG